MLRRLLDCERVLGVVDERVRFELADAERRQFAQLMLRLSLFKAGGLQFLGCAELDGGVLSAYDLGLLDFVQLSMAFTVRCLPKEVIDLLGNGLIADSGALHAGPRRQIRPLREIYLLFKLV